MSSTSQKPCNAAPQGADAGMADMFHIRLRHIWGDHWWITKISGKMHESHYRQELARKFTQKEARRVLRIIKRQCPNAEVVPAPARVRGANPQRVFQG